MLDGFDLARVKMLQNKRSETDSRRGDTRLAINHNWRHQLWDTGHLVRDLFYWESNRGPGGK